MPKIKQLDPHVADLIAAGEVVERPCSVVKELLENSLDAGATQITVEIQKGGTTYMRVTDNGEGMEEKDAQTAFFRHATSKLASGRDLESIQTLGFRGEALAAIAAVSRIDLFTKTQAAISGTSLSLEAGQILSQEPAGCPKGTNIIVRDLFFNTPARLKFLKSDRAEGAAIGAMLTRLALSRPDVSFRYLKDGKEEFHTPGDQNTQSAIYTLLGREFSAGLLEVSGEDDMVQVGGYVTAPAACKGNRAHQYFYLNGRYIRSRLLQAALEEAYRNVQFSGKFPACVLYLNMKFSAVDVNVHPTKMEVKFLHDKQVFDGVHYAVRHALENKVFLPEITLSSGTKQKISTPFPAAAPLATAPALGSTPPPSTTPVSPPNLAPFTIERQMVLETEPPTIDMAFLEKTLGTPVLENLSMEKTPPQGVERAPELPCPGGQAVSADSPPLPHRVIGEALGTYILVERGDALIFIDKHAAHERILFNELKAQDYSPMQQALIAPITINLGAERVAALMEQGELLEQFGFEIDQFSNDTVALRSVPGDLLDLDDCAGFLAQLVEDLYQGKTPDKDKVRDKVRHSLACQGAIKAGRLSGQLELERLAQEVLNGKVQYCPHGRPISLALSRNELDQKVRRV